MTGRALRHPSAWIPLVMSGAALALLFGHVALHGVTGPDGIATQQDEGTPARIFQLLMVAQLPFIGYFAATQLPREPRRGTAILALQVGLVAAAITSVIILESAA